MATSRTTKWCLKQVATNALTDIVSAKSMVGRNGEATVCLRSNKASRTHACVFVDFEGNLLVQDLKSSNGTFVNGTTIPVYMLHRVFPGDIVSFGLGNVNMADCDRDRHCFFEVMQVEVPSIENVQMEDNTPDSTTRLYIDLSANSVEVDNSRITSNEVKIDPTDLPSTSRQNDQSLDVIEIISIASDNSDVDQKELPELKITNTSLVPENDPSSKSPGKTEGDEKLFKKLGKPEVNPPRNSVDNLNTTKDLPPLKLLSRRRTVRVGIEENSKSSETKTSSSGSISSKKANETDSSKPRNQKETIMNELRIELKNISELNLLKSKNENRDDEKASCSKDEKKLKKQKTPLSKSNDKRNKTQAKKVSQPDTNEKKIENLGLKQYDSRRTKVDVQPVCNNNDKNYTTNMDNSVVIDITNDNDDDMDFSCSQIFQMSQAIKTEEHDDTYQKIKRELAEMDFCNEEIVLNPVPIDLEEDFEHSGFENTQAIYAYLQEGIEHGDQTLEAADEPETKSSSVSDVDQIPGTSTSSAKPKHSKPPIIEPHTVTKATRSARQKKSDPVKEDKTPKNKRKSSLDTSLEKKKRKHNSKSPIDPMRYDQKDILLELKRRHSTSSEIDKEQKSSIREGRRKKLKELAGADPNHNTLLDNASTSHPTDDPKNTKSCAIPKINKVASENTNLNKNKASGSRKSSTENSGYGTLTPIDLPPPPTTYNLRRAKSVEEIKLRTKSDLPGTNQSRLNARHSTSTDRSGQSDLSASALMSRLPDIKPITRDSRTDPAEKPPPSKMSYPSSVVPQETSSSLMWTNGGPARKKAVVRRWANVDDITKKMVQWLPNWLQEQIDIDSSPPLNSPPATKIPLNFRDFNHYHDTFTKLVLLESWQYIFKGFRESSEQPRKVKIEHVRVTNGVMALDCICYVSKQEVKEGNFYKLDDFVLFECVREDGETRYMSLNFGLIQCCRKTIISNDSIISVKLGHLCPGDPHTKLEFTVLTQYQPNKEINIKRMPIVKVLAGVRWHLMLIKAIKGLMQSPLCSMIVKPTMIDYKFTTTHRHIKQPHDLNEQQKSIVLEAASLCTGTKHGIYCVKGPPGTGKSTVIVNLIFQILLSYSSARKSGKPPMILLAAPSNTAVDNLIAKMANLKHSLRTELQQKIRCVRMGPESSISKDVIGYSLRRLAEKHVPVKNMDVVQIRAAKDRNENLIEFTKTFLGDQYAHELKICENLIIEKSNIIGTTLNSCINGRLIDAVNKGLIEFTCCIIDEVTQCHEVEALLPTILGIDKLVLVGDPKQLNATIMNRDAIKLGFGESLLTRLANNFRNDPRSPIRMLTDQYRMHPEICSFPNRQFYEGKLRSCPKPTNKLPENIRPYLVFNCENFGHFTDYTNMDEVILIQKLLATIFSMVDQKYKYTVGIITPYNAQKELICNNIADFIKENENCKIAINTVDSFQGSENDIIIISCVRDSSNSFLQNQNRLNVALTRAKQALYIIGNYTLFKECRPLYDLREDAKKRKVLLDIKQDPRYVVSFSKYLIKRNRNSDHCV